MCRCCNGDKDTQEPIESLYEIPCEPILTIIRPSLALSVITFPNGEETLYPIRFCPLCGENLDP